MSSVYACCDHCTMTEDHTEGHERPCSGRCVGSAPMTRKAPSSPVGTSEPVSGTSSYTGVIRDADGTEADDGIISRLGSLIRAQVDVTADQKATIVRLTVERDEAHTEVTRLRSEQSPHVAAKYWRELTQARAELKNAVDQAAVDTAALNGYRAGIASLTAQRDMALALLPDTCGGCQGQGSHRRHCRANPDYSREAEWADKAEALGDQVGPNNMAASNSLWRAAGLLRAGVVP